MGEKKAGTCRKQDTHNKILVGWNRGVLSFKFLYIFNFFQVKCKVIYNILVLFFQCIEKRLEKKGGI